jgi:purine-nucleoside/S-methyl-5'-thioadenosine phosphorylase / adenosine deaminase
MGEWIETSGPEGWLIAPSGVARGATVVFSGRGSAPAGTASPTEYLARRLARAAGEDEIPIVRATQVHGAKAALVREPPPRGGCVDAGEKDVLATALTGVALVVQTADCVPILLRSGGAVAAAHAGWRGSAANAARAAVEALAELGAQAGEIDAWIGPSIGSCCYEVGGEVAAQFAGDFARRDCAGKFRLDLKAVNTAQLAAAGVPRARISVHPGCTKCGGDRYASFRRDGAAAGRMIAMIARTRSDS